MKSSSITFTAHVDVHGVADGLSQLPSLVLILSEVPNYTTQVMKAAGVIPKIQLFSIITITMPSLDMVGVQTVPSMATQTKITGRELMYK